MPKLLEPSLKQKGWLKDYAITRNSSEAVRRNYSCSTPASVRAQSGQMLEKLRNGAFNLALAKELDSVLNEQETLEIITKEARTAKKSSDKLKATELMLKVYGLQKDKQEIEHSYKHESDDDLDAEFRSLIANSDDKLNLAEPGAEPSADSTDAKIT